MNRVTGRILVRESQLGIPNLLATLYNTNPLTSSRVRAKAPRNDNIDPSRWNRLASVITNEQGIFNIAYNIEKDGGKAHQRTDLLLTISSPKETSAPRGKKQKRNIATYVRDNAGSIESFLIHLEEKQLAAFGIEVPDRQKSTNSRIRRQREAIKVKELLRAESRKILAERLKKRMELQRAVEPKFAKFMSAISAFPNDQQSLASARYVPYGASVFDVSRQVIRNNIETRYNKATMASYLTLSDEQVSRYSDSDGNLRPEFYENEVHATKPGRKQPGRKIISERPKIMRCMPLPEDPCIKILENGGASDSGHGVGTGSSGDTGTTSGNGPDGGNGEADTKFEIPLLVENTFKHFTAPDTVGVFKVQTLEGMKEIKESINDGIKSFTIHTGPADVPAFYDFHHLSIAFEHVWQELFDNDFVKDAHKVYTDLVELGIDPNQYVLSPGEMDPATLGLNLKELSNEISNASGNGSFDPDSGVWVPGGKSEVPDSVGAVFANIIGNSIWYALSPQQQSELVSIADQILAIRAELAPIKADLQSLEQEVQDYEGPTPGPIEDQLNNLRAIVAGLEAQIEAFRKQGEQIIQSAPKPQPPKEPEKSPEEEFGKHHKAIAELGKSLNELYRFSIYAANGRERSVNFGVITTYRQKWEPVNYQVGQLVKSIPLAPKEVRKFTKRTVIKKSRAEKEVENNLRSRKTESSETTRAEREIVEKAKNDTNFKLTAEGGVNIGIADIKGGSEFKTDAATESQEIKKEFREAVFKAAEEYKAERTTEITESTGEESTSEEVGEISNPNDEITVTFLYYELQRRFRVTEKFHSLTPVILVAQEFPKPNEIDDDWLISHDWIVRRVILDDSFLPALNYITSKVFGDEFSLQEMWKNLEIQRELVNKLEKELVEIKDKVEGLYRAMQSSIEVAAQAEEADSGSGILMDFHQSLFGELSVNSPEAAKMRVEAARETHERGLKEKISMEERLAREITALNAHTERYTKELSDHLNRRAQIARLKIHIKSNIMYYMQAIWSHEADDQRFFRLHEVKVPKLTGKMSYTISKDADAIPGLPDWAQPYKVTIKCTLDKDIEDIEYVTLEQVADLDNLIGVKGNYMIFPAKELNPLHEFMMYPFYDPTTIVRDPDPLGEWTLSEFSEYVCCLHRNKPTREFQRLLPGLSKMYRLLMNTPGADGEEIVVPTSSLFIEALPGAHPILEDFKLMHRAVDVKKAQAAVRASELDNIRLAARILADELEDPTIEKKVVIEGGASVVVPNDPDNP